MKTTKKLLQYFLCYGFLGWILEGVFNLVTAGQFRKANFLHLPMKPMYGFGALAILIAHRYWPRKIFLTSCFLPCLVEYCSGYFLEHCFALRYWDYRQEFVQIKGYVKVKFEGTIEANALGCCNMCLGKEGKLKLSDKGREVLLLDVNTENSEIGIFM